MSSENMDPENMILTGPQTRHNGLKLGAAEANQQDANLNQGNQERRRVFGEIQASNVPSRNAAGNKKSNVASASTSDAQCGIKVEPTNSMELESAVSVHLSASVALAPKEESLLDESMEIETSSGTDMSLKQLLGSLPVEYHRDFVKYLLLLETEKIFRISVRYMQRQREIDFDMRATLVDWLAELREEFKLSTETLALAVAILDRFLSVMSCSRDKLQLAGVTAIFIAAKFEEVYPPSVQELVHLTDNTYTCRQLIKLEVSMLKVLRFQVATPTANTFLSIFLHSKSSNAELPDEDRQLLDSVTIDSFNQLELYSRYILELTLLQGETFLQFLPSELAAAALYVAADTLDMHEWRRSVFPKSGHSVNGSLCKCIEFLHKYITLAPRLQWPAIRDRYSSDEMMNVSRIRPRANIVVSEH